MSRHPVGPAVTRFLFIAPFHWMDHLPLFSLPAMGHEPRAMAARPQFPSDEAEFPDSGGLRRWSPITVYLSS